MLNAPSSVLPVQGVHWNVMAQRWPKCLFPSAYFEKVNKSSQTKPNQPTINKYFPNKSLKWITINIRRKTQDAYLRLPVLSTSKLQGHEVIIDSRHTINCTSYWKYVWLSSTAKILLLSWTKKLSLKSKLKQDHHKKQFFFTAAP